MIILDDYRKNASLRPLYSEIIDIDFYDGPTEALCRLNDSEQWFICSLVSIAFDKWERIFSLLEVTNDVLLKFKFIFENRLPDQHDFYQKLKEQVSVVYADYQGKVFLFKGDRLNAIMFEVVEIPLKDLQYFKDVEAVMGQSEESKLKWKRFFPSVT